MNNEKAKSYLKHMLEMMATEPPENLTSERDIKEWEDEHSKIRETLELSLDALEKLSVYQQIKWERAIAISQLEDIGCGLGRKMDDVKAAIEEVEQYRAMGTVEELKQLKEIDEDCVIRHLTKECSYNETGCSGCKGKEKIKDALEKQMQKKPNDMQDDGNLPDTWVTCICGANMLVDTDNHTQTHCWKCGQKLSWKEGRISD